MRSPCSELTRRWHVTQHDYSRDCSGSFIGCAMYWDGSVRVMPRRAYVATPPAFLREKPEPAPRTVQSRSLVSPA